MCEQLCFAGHGDEDGALREKLCWPKSCLHPLPDELTDIEGFMFEPLFACDSSDPIRAS